MTDDAERLDRLLHAALAGAVSGTPPDVFSFIVTKAVEALIAANMSDSDIGLALRRFADGTGIGWADVARVMSQHWGLQTPQPLQVH